MYFKELSKIYVVYPFHDRTIIPATLQGIKTGVKQSKHKNYFIVFFCSSVKGQVMRAFFKRRCTPARLMTNASPLTDVAVVAGGGAGCSCLPQAAGCTKNPKPATHIRRQLQFTFMFMANGCCICYCCRCRHY